MSYKVKCTVDIGGPEGPGPYTVTVSTNKEMTYLEVKNHVRWSFIEERPEVTLYSIDSITKV